MTKSRRRKSFKKHVEQQKVQIKHQLDMLDRAEKIVHKMKSEPTTKAEQLGGAAHSIARNPSLGKDLKAHARGVSIPFRTQDFLPGAGPEHGEFLGIDRMEHKDPTRRAELQEELGTAEARLRKIEREGRAIHELLEWVKLEDDSIQRPDHSIYHNFLQEVNSLIVMTDDLTGLAGWEPDAKISGFDDYQVFLVQHDWAAAFKNATDFAEGLDFHAPYDRCVFEFKLGNMRWLAFYMNNQTLSVIARTSVGWIAPLFMYTKTDVGWVWAVADPATKTHTARPDDGKLSPWRFLFDRILLQIKAVCVALEAKVADTDREDAPAHVNRQRVKRGGAPLDAYHVVRLGYKHTRVRTEPQDDWEAVRRRLHFRRGHWRHYDADELLSDGKPCAHRYVSDPDQLGHCPCTICGVAYRRWIEWMLVGDPDLGFIDKEYRL